MDLSGVIEVLETIADNKFVMGDQLIEVGVSGPNLEATLSAVAIAQSELGHARLLYNWVYDLKNGFKKGKKPDIKAQTGKAFSKAVKTDDWISLITSLYATDVTADVVLHAIADSPVAEKMPSVKKLFGEQMEHIIYARSWCNQLANDKGKIPGKFYADFSEISKEAESWITCMKVDKRLEKLDIFDGITDPIAIFKKEMDNISLGEVPV